MSESPENVNQQQYPNTNQVNPYYYYPQSSPAYYPMYNYRQFPQQQTQQPQQTMANPAENVPGMLPIQQSYIENILRLNRGKQVTVYMSFEGKESATFKGVIEAAGRDHIILSDPQTGKRFLLLMIYLDYVVFNEEINYAYPFGNTAAGQFSNYPPR